MLRSLKWLDGGFMRIVGWLFVLFLLALGGIYTIDALTRSSERKLIGASLKFEQGRASFKTLGSRKWTAPPEVTQQNRRAAILLQDYFYCHRQSGQVFRIPRGYQTDFASIPAVARLLTDRMGDTLEPAKIHDWLYSVGEGAADTSKEVKRAEADKIFLDAMEDNGVGLATRWIMYQSVRLGGGNAYGRGDEWNDRFRDTDTGEIVAPPIEKPSTASFAQINCQQFDEELMFLAACASTDETIRFHQQREIDEYTAAVDKGWRCLPPISEQ